MHLSILGVCVLLLSTVRHRDGVIRNPLPRPARPSESRLLPSFFRMMCEVFLQGKAKQTGRPKSLPLRDMPPPLQLPTPHTPTIPHIHKV